MYFRRLPKPVSTIVLVAGLAMITVAGAMEQTEQSGRDGQYGALDAHYGQPELVLVAASDRSMSVDPLHGNHAKGHGGQNAQAAGTRSRCAQEAGYSGIRTAILR